MNARKSGTPDYTMGFSECILSSLRRFTAERNAAYLLPYLRPGLRVLDFGCGPGTISVGLARAVAPGELHGIDMEKSQIDLARAVAAAGGQDNAFFRGADATRLPFDDNSFDVAHGHSILMHVPDTGAVLAEVRRVLKPGGILGCREPIHRSSFTYPDFGVMGRSWKMMVDLVAANDGHPQMGLELKGRMIEAGFANVGLTASFNIYSTPEEVALIYGIVEQWLLSPEIAEAAIKYGAATQQMCDDIRAAYDKWLEHPGAFAAIAYGEAVANKPVE